jgi:hypothetical protein
MTNAPTIRSIDEKLTALAQAAAAGAEVQVQALLLVMEGGYHGTLAHDDAQARALAYVMARGKHTIFDAGANSQKKLTSNFRKAITFGADRRWGAVEPVQNVNKLLQRRVQLRKQSAKGLEDAANMFLRYATAQRKSAALITGKDLEAFCFKNTSGNEKTAVEVLEDIRKLAQKLKLGKIANCHESYAGPEILTIATACASAIVTLSKNTP